MKIYRKDALLIGVCGVGYLLLLLLGAVEAEPLQWGLTIAITARYLYVALTKTGSDRTKFLSDHYHEAAVTLYGKHHALKSDLPILLTVVFLAVAALLRFGFRIFLPIWVWVFFVIALAVATAYSIGVSRHIEEWIDQQAREEAPPEDDGSD